MDNRYDCHTSCLETRDSGNKCDGNCLSGTPDIEDRIQKAQEHEE